MKSFVRVVSVAAASVFVGTGLVSAMRWDGEAASVATTKPAEDSEEVKLSVGREGEYDAMLADLKLSGEQLESFRAKDVQRIDSLKSFVASDDGKQLIALREQLAAARREKKPAAEVASIRSQITPLSDKYWAIRNQGRLDLLAILNEGQVKQYAGFMLYARSMRGLERIELSSDQQSKARSIADQAAAEWFRPEMVKSDPYFRDLQSIEKPTRDRILSEVITAEQKASLRSTTRKTQK